MESLRIPHGKEMLRVTISLGVATFPDHAEEGEPLIRSADAALYRSKEGGRNRVTVGERGGDAANAGGETAVSLLDCIGGAG